MEPPYAQFQLPYTWYYHRADRNAPHPDNIDYNSLKHHIKVHTTRDQATAIAIPGRQDTALGRFENDLYAELCRQHDRVNLFVTSKADEIARRLRMAHAPARPTDRSID